MKKTKVLNSTQLQTSVHECSVDPTGTISMHLNDRLSVRLYKDCRPNFLETGALQKGLVLLLDGRELVEEGVGFGLPIVKYMDKTFFSSKAEVSMRKNSSGYTLTKVYTLDTVSLKKFGRATYIDDSLYSPLRKTFHSLYLKHKKLTPLFNKVMEFRELANIKTEFVTVKSRGTVTVDYHLQSTGINIEANFSKVTLNKCCEVLILNELGSGVFEEYTDSSGLHLFGIKIGAWETVTADKATLQNANKQISFTLQNYASAKLFRGWERTRNRFSWAGLSYSMRPNTGTFNYPITVRFKTR